MTWLPSDISAVTIRDSRPTRARSCAVSENLWDVELLIEGRWSPASSGRTFKTTSNVTGRPIATVAAATLSDVDRAVDAAADAMDERGGHQSGTTAGHIGEGRPAAGGTQRRCRGVDSRGDGWGRAVVPIQRS